MSTLYEITGQYLALYEMLESADELEMKVITDTLEGMDGELEEKADAYAKIMTELDAEAAKFEKEADRLAEIEAICFPPAEAAERPAAQRNDPLQPEKN